MRSDEIVKSIAAVVLGIAIGVLVMWLAGGRGRESALDAAATGSAPGSSDNLASDAASVARLTEELSRERTDRVELEEQIAALEALLAERALAEDAEPVAGGETGSDAEADASGENASQPDQGWFDRDALAGAGFAPDEIDWVRELFERAVTARLELEDARLREGQGNALNALRDELALEQTLRAEFGDEGFDAVRFAMNEENRVILTDLLESSAGFQSGIRPGDEVISYDGQRIFRPRDLKLLIATGERDQPVEMRLLRDGEVVRVFVPRGPIGAQLAFEVRPPIR